MQCLPLRAVSGKRKHVLRFSLTPATPGADLEVVRAHLWLLLTRHHPSEDQPSPGKIKLRRSRGKDKVGQRRKHSRSRRNACKTEHSRSQNSSADIRSRDGQPECGNDSEDDEGEDKANGKQRVEESKGKENASVGNASYTSIDGRDQRREGERNGEDDNADGDDVVKKNDDENEEGKDGGHNDDDDDRFRAVLRVMLVSDNGTRSLMTYLRTTVRRTHWQKVQLPVSIIQQQLQSSHATITLLIRCRLCGGTVRMALPRDSRPDPGTGRRARQQGRKRRKKRRMKKNEVHHKGGGKTGEVTRERPRSITHGEEKEEGESHNRERRKIEKKRRRKRRRNRRRRHGVRNSGDSVSGGRRKRRREEKVEEVQQNQDNFRRPLPFLVINTRLRAKTSSS